MGYPIPERRDRMRDAQPGAAPIGPAGASSARQAGANEPDEIHEPTPDGPIESIGIRYRRDADGVARDIDPAWGQQIAAAAALIVQGVPTHVEVHVQGGVLTEKALRDAIRRGGPYRA